MIKYRHHKLHTFITEHNFTPHQCLKEVITNQFRSGNKVVLKHHTLSLNYMPAPWSNPTKAQLKIEKVITPMIYSSSAAG